MKSWHNVATKIIISVVVLSILFSIDFLYQVSAQVGPNEWSEPLNLSDSGVATEPLVIVNGDEYHVIWQDRFAGWVYTQGQGDNWTAPVPILLPFSEPAFVSPAADTFVELLSPTLVLDGNGVLHGFWLNEKRLFHSSVILSDLSTPEAWSVPQQLSASATTVAVIADSEALHLAYVRPAQSTGLPTGIYYQIRRNAEWGTPTLVHQSDYLRATVEQPIHLDMAVVDTGNIFVVWDNHLLDAVYLANSQDSGISWQEAEVVSRRLPDDHPQATWPQKIQIVDAQDQLHLTWLAGHNQSNCILYHQWSDDGGRTWQGPQPVFEDSQECPTNNYFIEDHSDLLIKLLTVREETYLLAWNGTQWSWPESQRLLAGFRHPQTYRQIVFSCLQPIIASENHLAIFGCGTGNTSDVWLRTRAIGTSLNWSFAGESAWSIPAPIIQTDARPYWPALVTDNGHMHLFWSQQISPQPASGTSVYYSLWNGANWSQPADILSSPSGQALAPVVAVEKDRLLVVWQGGQSGELYFSQATTSRANLATEWSASQQLPIPVNAMVRYPDIFVDASGTFHVAYVVALNEERGVYLTQSEDQGETWSGPVEIFDASAANWDMVGSPSLVAGNDGQLHLLWSRHTLPPDPQPVGLYYARSEDGGLTWGDAERVVESPIAWYQLITTPGAVHRFWQEQDRNGTVWHQPSLDNGHTWEQPARISAIGKVVQRLALATDTAGRIHLTQIERDIENQASLQHLIWQEEQWHTEDNLRLQNDTLGDSVELLTAIISDNAQEHQLVAIYLGQMPGIDDGINRPELQAQFLLSQRAIGELPAMPLAATATLTPVPSPTATLTTAVALSPVVTPIPTIISLPAESESSYFQIGPLDTSSTTGQLILGILPSLLVVIVVFSAGAYLRYVRRLD
jgi:hypothetical protein